MKKYLRYLGPILITCIFLGAIYLLYHKLKAYSYEQIRDSLTHISDWRLLASVGLMIVNYLILVGYDWLALVAIKKPLPIGKTALVSFIGQAVSYNFGALLGGTTVRYRFYSAWGFSLVDIVRLVLMLAVTFWVGALGLCGLVFIISPPEIPAELLSKMPITDVRFLGFILLAIALAYMVACHFIRKPITVFGREFVFPPLKIAILQAIVAGIDLIVAAGCMYVLLPGDLNIGFVQFLPSYLMAQVAVVLTHVPGGVGVFELVILHLTHTPREQVVVAAVLCFRLIYFILPLLAAIVFLAIYEARQRKNVLRDAGRWLSVLSHSICAWAVFGGGVFLLGASVLPAWKEGTFFLFIDWPAWVFMLLHWLCIFSGAVLLFIAYGLEMRQAIAWRLSLCFLALGMLCASLKGLSLLIVAMLALIFITVFLCSARFYRKSFFWEEAFPLRWLWPIWIVLFCGIGLGFAFHHWGGYAWSWNTALSFYNNLFTIFSVYSVLFVVWMWRIRQRRVDCKKKHLSQTAE